MRKCQCLPGTTQRCSVLPKARVCHSRSRKYPHKSRALIFSLTRRTRREGFAQQRCLKLCATSCIMEIEARARSPKPFPLAALFWEHDGSNFHIYFTAACAIVIIIIMRVAESVIAVSQHLRLPTQLTRGKHNSVRNTNCL